MKGNMGKVRGVIFDLGNTLIYLNGDLKQIASREAAELGGFLRKAGFDIDRTALSEAILQRRSLFLQKAEKEWIEYPMTEALREVLAEFGYKGVNPELIREAVDAFFSYEEELWRAYPDTYATLQHLSEQRYLLGLVSNASDDGLIQRLVDRSGLRRWLRPVLSSAGVGIRKPDPRILQIVLNQWGLSPQQAVMVGDRLEFDILGARLARMHSVLVSRGEDPQETGRGQITPDATIEQLSELPGIIAAL